MSPQDQSGNTRFFLTTFFSLFFVFVFLAQKLLKTSCFLHQSIGGAFFLLRLLMIFCLASAAVGLRRRPVSTKGSEIRRSSSSGIYNTHKHTGLICFYFSVICFCNLKFTSCRGWVLFYEKNFFFKLLS